MPNLTRRTLIVGLVIALAMPGGTAVAGDEATVIRDVIERQLAAFRADDAGAAYGFAAPMIRRMFPSPDIFMTMVRTGYPEVYRAQSYSFEPLEADGSGRLQKVWITGDNGERVLALYTMTRLDDGSWRIAGCVLLRPPGESA